MSAGIAARHWPGDPARPALALHCSMGSSSYWGPIATRLGRRVDLHAFDAPGHGRSAPYRAGTGGDYHSNLTALAAARLPGDGRPVDLIGHSLGATVALRLAVEAPERVRSLTLIEPVMFAAVPGATDDPLFALMGRLLAQGRDEDAARAFIDSWGADAFDSLPPAQRARRTAQVRLVAEVNEGLIHDRFAILRPGGLEAIIAPVMLIRGGDSPPVIGAIADALAQRLADVARAVVPGAGHMVPITHPDPVAGLIATNLDRAPDPTG